MPALPAHDPHLPSRGLFIWTAMPVALAMIYLASIGREVSFPTQRPGGSKLITWQESPFGFVLYGLVAYMVTCVVALVFRAFGKFVIEEIRPRRRR